MTDKAAKATALTAETLAKGNAKRDVSETCETCGGLEIVVTHCPDCKGTGKQSDREPDASARTSVSMAELEQERRYWQKIIERLEAVVEVASSLVYGGGACIGDLTRAVNVFTHGLAAVEAAENEAREAMNGRGDQP